MPSVTLCQVTYGNIIRKRCNVSDIGTLRDEASSLISKPKEEIRLIWRGRILSDNSDQIEKLAGSMVNIVVCPSKIAPEVQTNQASLSDEDLRRFQVAFGYAVRSSNFIKVVRRLLLRENMDSLAAACPGLAQDHVAQAFLTRPELLLHLLHPETLEKISQKHPALYEAAHNVAAAVHEEQSATSSGGRSNTTENEQGTNQPELPGGFFLDEMSDDEMDEDEGDGRVDAARGRQPPPQISTQQLAAALAAVSGGQIGPGGQPNPFMGVTGMAPTAANQPTNSAATANLAGNRITNDMLQSAMQQVMGMFSSNVGGGTSSAGTTAAAPAPASTPDWSDHFATMREMGIVDEGLATRALEVMGGDLQAAVDLILSGWVGDDTVMQ